MLDGLTHKTPGRSGTHPEMRERRTVESLRPQCDKSPENIAEDYSEGVGIELDEEAVRRYRAA